MPNGRPIVFSPRAEQDVQNIAFHTLQQWGIDQAQKFEAEMISSISLLGEFPELGRAASALRPNVRILTLRYHRVTYDLAEDAIRVLRIEHHRQRLSDD